jgi:hypothetical protein
VVDKSALPFLKPLIKDKEVKLLEDQQTILIKWWKNIDFHTWWKRVSSQKIQL